MKTIKFEVETVTDKYKLYKLDDSNGKRLATIEKRGWVSLYKYCVSFAFGAVENNLEKGRSFNTLKEAKQYIEKILNQ